MGNVVTVLSDVTAILYSTIFQAPSKCNHTNVTSATELYKWSNINQLMDSSVYAQCRSSQVSPRISIGSSGWAIKFKLQTCQSTRTFCTIKRISGPTVRETGKLLHIAKLVKILLLYWLQETIYQIILTSDHRKRKMISRRLSIYFHSLISNCWRCHLPMNSCGTVTFLSQASQ